MTVDMVWDKVNACMSPHLAMDPIMDNTELVMVHSELQTNLGQEPVFALTM